MPLPAAATPSSEVLAASPAVLRNTGDGPVIETDDLHKTYAGFFSAKFGFRQPAPALQGVSLRVERGQIFGLIGANGAGKTTLVKILLGISNPSAGSARLLGGRPGDGAVRRKVGYLPEQMRVQDHLRAESFMRLMGRYNGVPSSILKRRIPELLEQVGLAGVRKPVKEFSKGMQQRLGLAQALINDPQLLFLDEPTDSLDPVGRKEVRDLLARLRAEGRTVFLNSHLLSEIEMVCDKIVILHRGQVARTGTPEEFTRGAGDVLIRVAAVTQAIQTAAAGAAENLLWQGTTLRFAPRNQAHLNEMFDRLRAAQADIEAVEPMKTSLEDFFLKVVGAGTNGDGASQKEP
jgi:ABC-2 type transport system ATP-binding protein